MPVLLDTHTFIWLITGDPLLSQKARAVLEDEANVVWFSVASAWEITIKQSKGTLALEFPVEELLGSVLDQFSLQLLPIKSEHLTVLSTLQSGNHKDPFDRMLAAQSLSEGFPLLSVDPWLQSYGVTRIW